MSEIESKSRELDFRPDYAMLAALLFGSFVLRFILLLSSQRYLQSDEALVGMIAMDIMEGRGIPIFPYGNAYGGGHIIEALLMVPLFKIFGPSDLVVAGVPAFISCVLIGVVYLFACAHFGRRHATVAGLFLSLSAPFVAYNYYVNGSMTTLLLGWCGMGLFFRHIFADQAKPRTMLASGFFIGAAYYGFDYALFYLASVVLMWGMLRGRAALREWKVGLMFMSGFLIGALPLIVFNLRHNFENLRNLTARTAGSDQSFLIAFPLRLIRLFAHDLPAFFSTSIYDFPDGLSALSWIAYGVFVASLGWVVWKHGLFAVRLLFNAFRSDHRESKGSDCMACILAMFALYALIYSASSSGGESPRYLLPFYPMIPLLMAQACLEVWARRKLLAQVMAGIFLLTQAVFIVRLATDRHTTEWNISTDGRDIAKLAKFLEEHKLTTVLCPYEIKWKLMFATERRIICAAYLFGYDRETRFNREVVERVNRGGISPALVCDKDFKMIEIAKNFNPDGAFDLPKFLERLRGGRITYQTAEVGDYVVLHGFSRHFPLPDPYGKPAAKP